MRVRLAAAIVLFALAAALASGEPALAGEPTPTPEPTETAAPTTSLGSDQIVVRVIEDTNSDGVAQDDEPGISGATVDVGCYEGFRTSITDDGGFATVLTDELGLNDDGSTCARLRREFGWHPTSSLFLPSVPTITDPDEPVIFLIRDLGDTVMELTGDAIQSGLPAKSPDFLHEAPPFIGEEEGCSASLFDEFPSRTQATVIVIGADTRPGCVLPGNVFSILMNGGTAASLTFEAGPTANVDFVVGGDSMRFVGLSNIDDVVVFDNATVTLTYGCGVAVELGGTAPNDYLLVAVLSEEAKAGCGTEGRSFRLVRDGRLLDPLVEWIAGEAAPSSPPLVFMEPGPNTGIEGPDTGGNQLTPPDTGSGGYR